jgi:hypothetical protein
LGEKFEGHCRSFELENLPEAAEIRWAATGLIGSMATILGGYSQSGEGPGRERSVIGGRYYQYFYVGGNGADVAGEVKR